MPAFYIAPEASIPYTIVGPSGARAVLNDPTDPDFCGYLDGDDAISGIDSPEIRDTYADLVEAEGGLGGTNFYSRRPIVMNGIVIPSSASDRNAKLGKLMAATDARSSDGILSWTPTGGEAVFLKFRRQLPFRATGGFNKKFQIGLVANDPRIYTVRQYTLYTETNGNTTTVDYRRCTYASGAATASIATRSLYLPPGTYTATVPVKCSQVGRALGLWDDQTYVSGAKRTATGNWQYVSRTFTKVSAETSPMFVGVVTDVALTAGNYFEFGDLRIESAAGLAPSDSTSFATNWSASAGYTLSFQSSSPPISSNGFVLNAGNAPSPPRQRLLGPLSGVYATQTNPTAQIGLYPSSAYFGSDYAVINHATKTVKKNNTTSALGSVELGSSRWGGIAPDAWTEAIIMAYAGATTATRLETSFRGVWL